MTWTLTLNRALAFAAFVLFIIAAILCFVSSDVSLVHIVGFACIGLACFAGAAVV